MAEGLDMSLDDMIVKRNQTTSKGQNGNFKKRARLDASPLPSSARYSRQPFTTSPYVQQMVAITGLGTEVGTKLYVSNLDYGVSNEDIKILFSEIGMLQRYSINYDRSGRSKGTAEVVYTRQSDALAAIERYNNVHLDGKPMKLELVGGVNFIAAPPVPPITDSILGMPNGNVLRQDGILGRGGDIDGAVRRGRGSKRGHGRGKGHVEKVSAESLDADLEKYRLEATKIK